jgi:hypothetical protein
MPTVEEVQAAEVAVRASQRDATYLALTADSQALAVQIQAAERAGNAALAAQLSGQRAAVEAQRLTPVRAAIGELRALRSAYWSDQITADIAAVNAALPGATVAELTQARRGETAGTLRYKSLTLLIEQRSAVRGPRGDR